MPESDSDDLVWGTTPVAFGHKMVASSNFRDLFREGMALLEETADYLDGPGRTESRALSRLGGLAYAAESMKLTTRLMQLASWLLIHRAVNEGEMTETQASREKSKVKLQDPGQGERSTGYDELPEALKALITRSVRLQQRIRHLDGQLSGGAATEAEGRSPVDEHLARLQAAFGGRQER